jgi:hypothetical protein
VKKFAYILSGNQKPIEKAKFFSDRYALLLKIIEVDLAKTSDSLIPIELDIAKIGSLLKLLIEERKSRPLDVPDYKSRFTEDEIFVEKKLYGQVFKLCNTGFDSQIIFLANLLERQQSEVLKDRPAYIFLVDNHKELRDYLLFNESPS